MSNVYHALLGGNFAQDWSDGGLIATDGNWDNVPSIIGYRGDNDAVAIGTNPQLVLGDSTGPLVGGVVSLNVEANETNPATFATGGVAEFALTNPTIALNGSGTADAPYIVVLLNTTGVSNVVFSFNARDLDASVDNAVQQLAVQYRVGASGAWTDIPAGFVADATSGPSLATLVTPVSVTLPTAAENQAQVQVRVITVNAAGNDEWAGIDDILVTSTAGTAATVSIADAAILEGNAGTTPLAFTLTRTDTTAAATVDYAITFPTSASANDIASALTGTASFAAGAATAAVTVQVVGDTTGEANETFTVTLSNPSSGLALGDAVAVGTITNDDLAITRISAIQGAGAASALVGQTVTVDAIVVGDFQDGDTDTLRNINGFFLQEENVDWDLSGLTSEGIFIFQNSLAGAVNLGDRVQVTGVVGEAFGVTQITLTSVSVVQAAAVADVRTLAVDVTLPEAGVTGAGTNPDIERYEGMIVSFPQTLTITEMFDLDRFNEIRLVAGERPYQYTHDNAPNVAGNAQHLELIGSRTITYDDGENIQNRPIGNLDGFQGFSDAAAPSMGDTVSDLTGVLDFAFSEWHVRSVTNGSNSFANTVPRDEAPPARSGSLDIASFNVLNFFKTLGEEADNVLTASGLERRGANNQVEFDRQVGKLITALSELNADIYGLIELENDFTPGSSGNAIELIVNRLNLATGKTFAYVPPGGQLLGGDAIAVGYIYDTTQVRIAAGTTVQVLSNADVSADLLAQSTIGTIFDGTNTSRNALAVTWEEIASGETFTSVVNHFKSKSGAGNGLDADAGDGAGGWNNQRLLAAKALDAWLATNPTGTTDADKLILGDLNSYFKEAPISYLEGAGFENLQLRLDNPYSYVFDGQLGALDYILSNASLGAQVASVGEWHLNSNEADALDYNLDFGRLPGYFDGTSPFRVSDHDPVVVSLALGAPGGVVPGTPGPDSLVGGNAADTLSGEGGNDTLSGGAGSDIILGGDGTDTAVFAGTFASADITVSGNLVFVSGGEGSDTLSGVERLSFSNGSVNLADGDALFDSVFYLRQNADVFAAGIDPVAHYRQVGAREGRDPNAFFDTSGYLAANKDVAASGLNPLEHFRLFGAKEQRDTSIDFDTGLYLKNNQDVASSGINALDHFLNFGRAEGRASYTAIGKATADGFDAEFYLLSNADVAASGIDPREHFIRFGAKEGRDPNVLFDSSVYLANNADVRASGLDPMTHYNLFGFKEGRDPSAAFDTSAYLAANADVAAAGINPLTHYLNFGVYEGRAIADQSALIA
ncbi:ExeM/NucH family extracellular endonuclease [Plastoroseomonas arctica]|uniref:ExeM/NucH family extracellular endonuclease n=1 Tax=Plastoroseomonas arctica TaxID=1509237 RepID=UPI0024848E2B|nr:ExeM/NucH family extracellular endonuclease [Plastoroseomonas arctica]